MYLSKTERERERERPMPMSTWRTNQVRKIKGEGMPVHNFPSDKGDLYVTYKIKMPSKITDEARGFLEQAAAAGGL